MPSTLIYTQQKSVTHPQGYARMVPVLAVPDVQAHEEGRARPHRHVEDVGAGDDGGGVSHMPPPAAAMQEDYQEDREEAEAEIVARG